MRLHVESKFSAAHKVPSDPGECSKLHGHTFKVSVDVEGPVDPFTGMVINFRDIKNIIKRLDHVYLNDIVEIPTAEALATYIADEIIRLNSELNLVSVRVYESEDCYAEITLERRS